MQVERQWVLLQILQEQRHPKSTEDLWRLVNNDIHSVSKRISKRTVERDIAHLFSRFPEVAQRTEGRTNFWYWESNAKKPTLGVTDDDASRIADETRVLREALQPSSFEFKIAQHVPGFIGREWIFDAYSHWIDHQPESRLFWIKAKPGFGKSAIAANIVHRKRSSVAANWFCDGKSSELKDPNKVLKSIAFQLALRWEDYRIRLLNKLHLHANASNEYCDEVRKELEKKSTQDIFLSILAEPMAGLWRDHKIAVVIDALDEATDEQGNNRIVELISKELGCLPEWIGFVVTSRPEIEVINRLSGFKSFEIDANDPRNLADLRNWYKEYIGTRSEFQELPSAEQQRIEDLLIERSSGMILFLKVVEEGFQEGSLTVAGLEGLESGLPGLNRRYYDSFQHRFGSDYENSVKPLLRLLLAAGGPLPEDLACKVLEWNSEQFLVCLNRLGSYVVESMTGYELFHETLSEWLSDKSSGPFHLDRALGRQILADALFDELKNQESHLVRWHKAIQVWLPEWLPQLSRYNDPSLVEQLGNTLMDWADYSTAHPLLERSLAIREKSLGPEHPDTASSLNNLALLLRAKGDYVGAEPLYRRALAIREKAFGTDHPDTATSLNNLGWLLKTQGDYAGAEPLFRRALAIREKVFGPDHPKTATILNNLALLLQDLGDYVNAESMHLRALAIQEKFLGSEHPDTAKSLNNLGGLLRDKGDYVGADTSYRRALTIFEKILGPEHPTTATTYSGLGSLLKLKGELAEAEIFYRKAIDIRKRALGDDAEPTMMVKKQLDELLNEKKSKGSLNKPRKKVQ